MKKTLMSLMSLALVLVMATQSLAFLYEIEILTKDQISKLSDAQLEDDYTEAAIEIEASKTFHGKAGFTPKEYKQHKDLLRYVVYLKMEINKRELTPPPVEEWVK